MNVMLNELINLMECNLKSCYMVQLKNLLSIWHLGKYSHRSTKHFPSFFSFVFFLKINLYNRSLNIYLLLTSNQYHLLAQM